VPTPPSRPPHADGLAEEDLRFLQADWEAQARATTIAHDRVVSFFGEQYDVTGTGLVALLRYAGQRKDPTGQVALAAVHRILEESLGDFTRFQNAAIEHKATPEQVMAVVCDIVEIHCARPWRAALRLLGYCAGSLAELDGKLLLTTGRGIGALTPRQLCNLAYAQLLDGRDEEQREEFTEDLYLDYDPEDEARKQVLAMIAAQEDTGG
jgi:hypothetical protein